MQLNILLITYYWPPSGGAGVQRWLKMSKYLVAQGYNVTVYTPSNPELTSYDNSLALDIHPSIKVIKRRIWEPYRLYKFFLGGKSIDSTNYLSRKGKSGFLFDLALKVRSAFFLPDPRVFWVKPSVRFLSSKLKRGDYDVIISTGPPHSVHLIAKQLKNKFKTKWIADFRDPWTQIDFYADLKMSESSHLKNAELEKSVLNQADAVVSVSDTCSSDLSKISGDNVFTIFNGYDASDFENNECFLNEKFTISYFGSMNKDRNPYVLWDVLKDCHEQLNDRLQIEIYGTVNSNILEEVKNKGIIDSVFDKGYRSHSEVTKLMSSSHLLLLVLNNTVNGKGIISGKIFEYLATGRPILCIGDLDSDGAKLLIKSGAGCVFDYNDFEGVKNYLLSLFQTGFLDKINRGRTDMSFYTRENQAREYAKIIEEVVSN